LFQTSIVKGAFLALALLASPAVARDQVQVSGSSTVLPYASIVAEAFGENTSFKTPVVEGGGSSAGLKKFCEGVGENMIDIANSSRKIRSSEIETCKANGVTEIIEVLFGYDGIVFASDRNGPGFAFTPSILFEAMSAEVLVKGKLVANPYTKWSDIKSGLPDQEILVFVPGTKHGTREVFDERVVTNGCKMFETDKAFSKRDGDAKGCLRLRTDGRVIDIDGDYTETLARLQANKNAIGVFGLSFYENNTNFLRVATFQGIEPTRAAIASGKYPVSRPIFFYIKKAHIGVIPGLQEYAEFFVSDEIAGPGGPLEAYGLVPNPKLSDVQATVASGKKM
jgi:phosphate transport system substrate-binding protein